MIAGGKDARFCPQVYFLNSFNVFFEIKNEIPMFTVSKMIDEVQTSVVTKFEIKM